MLSSLIPSCSRNTPRLFDEHIGEETPGGRDRDNFVSPGRGELQGRLGMERRRGRGSRDEQMELRSVVYLSFTSCYLVLPTTPTRSKGRAESPPPP